jgi:23S rRNA (cytidine1920-2'-O)/16S rRNA (cytidine1409-2'-O)-methyltransferase
VNARAGSGRERLDLLLVERGLAPNRTQAQALVLAGRVHCGGTRLDKPGLRVARDAAIEITPGRRWVGRGAEKLDGVLDAFGIDARREAALDVGASTGGFTEVLLARGCRRVIALDVGRGQLDWSLRNDERVHVVEGLNARLLTPELLPCRPSLATIDVSFISLRLVLPAVVACLEPGGEIVALVKPQFEVGREAVGRGGIVREPALHRDVLRRLVAFCGERRWAVAGIAASPIRGAEGNREFFLHLRPAGNGLDPAAIEQAIAQVAPEAGP